jgi:cell division protein ZapD
MINDTIVYEQPLNELIRVCLRIELIFSQIDHQFDDVSLIGSRNVIASIINLLQILDRPDLKAKLAKELSHQNSLLLRLENTPEIDQEKLHALLKQIDELTRCFIDSSKKIGQNLREIELLNTLRLHLASPGGGCSFDIPLYHYWLNQPIETRQTALTTWIGEFNTIRAAASLILRLVRESAKSQQKTADHGFYQELLDPQTNLRMIRVWIPKNITAYPEISIGRHYLSVRFFYPNVQERPTQYFEHLLFWISHCSS